MSIWDGGWAGQLEVEREGEWFKENPEPWWGEDAVPEEEFDDEAGDEWKRNDWSRAELAGPEYQMFKKRQDEEEGREMATTDEQPKEQPNEQPEDGDALDLGPGMRIQLAQEVSHEPPLRLLPAEEYALMEREWCEIQRLMRGGR